MNAIDSAPRDGTRILLRYMAHHYQTPTSRILDRMGIQNAERRRYYQLVGAGWQPTGLVWREAWWDESYLAIRWVEEEGMTVSEQVFGGWMPWNGQYELKSNVISDPRGWLPLPGEENGPCKEHRFNLESYKRRLARQPVVSYPQYDDAGDDDD